jgi:general secretion pathway protein J
MTRRDAGFTLIELLVSVTIFALLMVVLIGALRLGSREVGRLTGQVDQSSQIALVQNFLRAQIGAAEPLVSLTDDSKIVQFAGDAHRVDFVAAAPESLPAGGLLVFSAAWREGTGPAGGQLVLGWRPLREDPDATAAVAPPTVLLDHVRAATFVYYGPATPAADPEWHATWQHMTYLPLLVRLSVVFTDGKTMPDLAVALRLSMSVADLRLNNNRRF